jgi:mannose-6-phosphate isomerase-like protein (cupin superfamily)
MSGWLGWILLPVIAGFSGFPCHAAAAHSPAGRSVEEILRSYVQDFRRDAAAAEPTVFGIVVSDSDDPEWHVVVTGRDESTDLAGVELRSGLPPSPSAVYRLNLSTLGKLDRGEMNALTAMGRARAGDPTPMDIDLMPGFRPGEDFFARFLPFTFHFWTRGFPETVPFGAEHSREVHGANAVVFYYRRGLRSAWAQVEPGQHVNPDPRDQSNPFPSMLIGIRGRVMAKIGGVETTLESGWMVFIPAEVTHEAWNPFEEPAEVILLMFGEGA